MIPSVAQLSSKNASLIWFFALFLVVFFLFLNRFSSKCCSCFSWIWWDDLEYYLSLIFLNINRTLELTTSCMRSTRLTWPCCSGDGALEDTSATSAQSWRSCLSVLRPCTQLQHAAAMSSDCDTRGCRCWRKHPETQQQHSRLTGWMSRLRRLLWGELCTAWLHMFQKPFVCIYK